MDPAQFTEINLVHRLAVTVKDLVGAGRPVQQAINDVSNAFGLSPAQIILLNQIIKGV